MPRKIDDKTLKTQKEKDEKIQTLTNVGLAGAAVEVVGRIGKAIKEFFVGYGGVDNETGKVYSKSLEGIAKSKVNPDYKDNNIDQQKGFSAEVESTSRKNADNIINGKESRYYRTDDIKKQEYGKNTIGGKNDPLYDHVELDPNGKPIPNSATQMKFVGKGGNASLRKLTSAKFQKYFDNEVPIEVPSDYYDSISKAAEEKAKKVQDEIDHLIKNKPNEKTLEEKQRQLKKLEGIRDGKSVRKSNVSSKEARFARLHPKLSTAKDIAKYSHNGATEQAGTGAVIGGSISIIKNVVAVVKGEKEAKDAVKEVIIDTGRAAGKSYITTFTGVAIKGAMQNAKSPTMRAFAKTSLPAKIVTLTVETGITLSKFIKGEIDGVQCLEELGEKGTGIASSAVFTSLGAAGAVSVFGKFFVIGQITIPIPVIGGLIGSMLGYALSSACYGQLTTALKEAKIAREQRIQIEAECAEAIRMIKEYRTEIEETISKYLSDHIITFRTAFDKMQTALDSGDIDRFIAGANKITLKLGRKPQYRTMKEFESFMNGSDKLLL
jgi:hypothetical protein